MKKVSNFDTKPHLPIVQPRTEQTPSAPPAQVDPQAVSVKALVLARLDNLSKRALTAVCLLLGIGIGLYYAWMVDPVEWTGMSYQHLPAEQKMVLVEMASDLNAYDPSSPAVENLRAAWPELYTMACFAANHQVDTDEQARLKFLAFRVNQRGCE